MNCLSPSRLRRRARRAQARAEAAMNAAQGIVAVDAAVQTDPNAVVEQAAQTTQEPEQAADHPPLVETMEAAVQAAPETTDAIV